MNLVDLCTYCERTQPTSGSDRAKGCQIGSGAPVREKKKSNHKLLEEFREVRKPVFGRLLIWMRFNVVPSRYEHRVS